ncbi:MAG: hypothetical protein HZB18_00890 [Chloroflexi bacterium]|nr:hypothetical protein [Chloroflexota bacterium]
MNRYSALPPLLTQSWRPLTNQMKWHFAFVTQQRGWLLSAIAFHFLSGLLSGRQILALNSSPYSQPPTIGDGLFLAFSGPSLGNSNLVILLAWMLNKVFFMMLIGGLVNRQLGEHDYVVMLMVRSRRIWWLGIATTVIITAIGYVSVTVVATLAGISTQLSWYSELSSFFVEQGVWQAASAMSLAQVTAAIFSLTVSSLAVAGLIQTLVALHTHRTIWGIFTVLTLALIAWIIGLENNAQSWQQWLPEVQSILSRHSPFEPRLPNFTLNMSLAYNAISILSLALAGFLLLRTFDFLGAQDDD